MRQWKFIAAAILALWTYTEAAENLVWSPDVLVTLSPLQSGFQPQVVTDGQGNAVAMWVESAGVKVAYSAAGTNRWFASVGVSGTIPSVQPVIAINSLGQGVVVYDAIDVAINAPFFYVKRFTVSSSGVFVFSDPSKSPYGSSSLPAVLSIDSSGNVYIAYQYYEELGGFYIQYPGTTWVAYSPLFNSNQRQGNRYGIAVNGSGVGLSANYNEGSGGMYSNFIAGSTSTTYYSIDQNIPSGAFDLGLLVGVDASGNNIAFLNTQHVDQNTWQIFFAPLGLQQWFSSRQIEAKTQLMTAPYIQPVLNVNPNGLGVLAYNDSTNNNIHAIFLKVGSQQVGRTNIIGQGLYQQVATDGYGSAFAVWVGPQGYLRGSWLPSGFSRWQPNTQISNTPVAPSGTPFAAPSMSATETSKGVVVYATADGYLYSVFFDVENPDIIKQGSIVKAVKNSKYHLQKGL